MWEKKDIFLDKFTSVSVSKISVCNICLLSQSLYTMSSFSIYNLFLKSEMVAKQIREKGGREKERDAANITGFAASFR